MKRKNFEDWVQDYFVNEEREVDGVPIIKDNFEDMFEGWITNLDVEEWFNLADKYEEASLSVIKQIVIEDVPHEYQQRLLNTLN